MDEIGNIVKVIHEMLVIHLLVQDCFEIVSGYWYTTNISDDVFNILNLNMIIYNKICFDGYKICTNKQETQNKLCL